MANPLPLLSSAVSLKLRALLAAAVREAARRVSQPWEAAPDLGRMALSVALRDNLIALLREYEAAGEGITYRTSQGVTLFCVGDVDLILYMIDAEDETTGPGKEYLRTCIAFAEQMPLPYPSPVFFVRPAAVLALGVEYEFMGNRHAVQIRQAFVAYPGEFDPARIVIAWRRPRLDLLSQVVPLAPPEAEHRVSDTPWRGEEVTEEPADDDE